MKLSYLIQNFSVCSNLEDIQNANINKRKNFIDIRLTLQMKISIV